MDNNFYNILQTFKRLDEGMTKEAMWRDAERMTREQFCDKWGQEHAEFWDKIMGEMDEGSMADAEHHSTGPKFTGYWKGTDKRTPRQHMVGGSAEESAMAANYVQGPTLEDELMSEWEQYMQEAGANNPAQGQQNATPADIAKATQTSQRNLASLKNLAGVDIPSGVATAAQSTAKTATNPTAIPTSQDRKVQDALGQDIQQLAAKLDPNKFNQIANSIKQAKQGM